MVGLKPTVCFKGQFAQEISMSEVIKVYVAVNFLAAKVFQQCCSRLWGDLNGIFYYLFVFMVLYHVQCMCIMNNCIVLVHIAGAVLSSAVFVHHESKTNFPRASKVYCTVMCDDTLMNCEQVIGQKITKLLTSFKWE